MTRFRIHREPELVGGAPTPHPDERPIIFFVDDVEVDEGEFDSRLAAALTSREDQT